MSLILVTPLSAVEAMLRQHQPSHLVSLLSPEFMHKAPSGGPHVQHLKLAMHDIPHPEDGKVMPGGEHIDALIRFGRSWDGTRPMIVHCWAGVSRSMAAAYSILCLRAGPGAEDRLAKAMRARAPHAYPNRMIIQLADSVLARDGHMIAAVEAMGPAVPVEEGVPVAFPLGELGL